MRGNIDDVWVVIDGIRKDVGVLSGTVHGLTIESEHCKNHREASDKKIDEMCTQLKATEREVTRKIEEGAKSTDFKLDKISAGVQELKDAANVRAGLEKGAKETTGFFFKNGSKIVWVLIVAAFFAGMYIASGVIKP